MTGCLATVLRHVTRLRCRARPRHQAGLRRGKVSANICGVKAKASTTDSATPPAIDMAKGGQNPPPPRISGRKPPTVVIVVDVMCRADPATTSTIAARSPALARASSCSADSTISAALIDTPIDPMTPMIALIPKG